MLDFKLDSAAEQPAQAPTAQAELALDLSLRDVREFDGGGQQICESHNFIFVHSAL
jgi:hypothetical protein